MTTPITPVTPDEIPSIKRFESIDDPYATWEDRFGRLMKHHEEETKWYAQRVRDLKTILTAERREIANLKAELAACRGLK